jgi:L-lactate permease
MIPLLFIILVTGLSILVSAQFSSKVTWFTYYVGGIAGLLVSGLALEIWNKRRRAKEEEEAKAKEKKRAVW